MTVDLSDLTSLAAGDLTAAFLVFLRVGAAMALMPVFGEMVVPVRVRLALTLAFTLVVFPTTRVSLGAVIETVPVVQLALLEVAAGLLLGLSLRLLIVALHVAGSIAAQATSLSQLLGGALVDPQPALGNILLWAALALAATMGLHLHVAAFLIQSYLIIPPGSVLPAADILQWLVPSVAQMFQFAFLAAMPFVAASLMYNLTLGAINRAMPQLMVAFVGAPAITLGALVLLFLSAPLILIAWFDLLQAALSAPLSVP